jgi:hypothetical protein
MDFLYKVSKRPRPTYGLEDVIPELLKKCKPLSNEKNKYELEKEIE